MQISALQLSLCAWLVLLSWLTARGSAQIIGRSPNNFKLDGAISEWPAGGGMAQDGEGLVIAGSAQFYVGPAHRSIELTKKGRIELWISEVDHVEMPPISWLSGRPLTEEVCEAQSSGAKDQKQICLQWLADQPAYREKLQGLFTRMWRIAPGVVEEAYAAPVFATLTESQKRAVKLLKPIGLPFAKFLFDEWEQKFTYEIHVPWEAFPPSSHLHMERIKLALNVVEGDEVRISYQPFDEKKDFARPSLRWYVFSPAVISHYTPCDYPLVPWNPIYYFPGKSLLARSVFTLENPFPHHFTTAPPGPDDFSPVASPQEHFVQALGPDEYLCSPHLRYKKGPVSKEYPFVLAPPEGFDNPKPPVTALPVLLLPNGTRLLKNGPTWSFRQQSYTQCGGCPWGTLTILALTPSGDVKQALSLGERVGGQEAQGYQIEVSPNWRTVTEFRNKDGEWSSKSYCLNGNLYRVCGERSNSPPPKSANSMPRF